MSTMNISDYAKHTGVNRKTISRWIKCDKYIVLAAELGYAITITEFRQARAGISICGDPLNGEEWPFVWRVNAGGTAISYAQAGISYCGDPLRSWGDRYLKCKFNQLSPPHTILQVSYNQ